MKKIVMSFALTVLCTLGVNAQAQGDWYVGTGDRVVDSTNSRLWIN